MRELGRGGMGLVFEAVHPELEKRVAIKALRPLVAVDPTLRRRFLREGRAAARVRHPHLVDVTDIGTEGEVPFLVMEYLDGETLGARLAREGTLSVTALADLALPVCSALQAAHDAGIVHRDVKPANVFLARAFDGGVRPVLLDFGISRLDDGSDGKLTRAGLLGTPEYMCPEQVRGAGDVDARCDVYALGAVLYECLTGAPPVAGDSVLATLARVGVDECPRVRSRRPELPGELDALVAGALQRERERRTASARELGLALWPFASATAQVRWSAVFGPPGRDARDVRAELVAAAPPVLEHAPARAPGAARPRGRATWAALLGCVAGAAFGLGLTASTLAARLRPAGVARTGSDVAIRRGSPSTEHTAPPAIPAATLAQQGSAASEAPIALTRPNAAAPVEAPVATLTSVARRPTRDEPAAHTRAGRAVVPAPAREQLLRSEAQSAPRTLERSAAGTLILPP